MDIGAVFVPVSDIERAKAWYARLLQVDAPETLYGHLAVFPRGGGARLLLDAKIFASGSRREAPLFHFDTQDVAAAYSYATSLDVEIVTPVQFEQWFTIRDPDGNVLMICRC
ncbi:VOC family protein [Ensifer sp. SSB1]|uniref:VOC family protein n=1 Tax=Ensifer sp. SSB1 TaxID=2795385 RepID=UPI001A4C4D93|nr:VOC family protein [Ensifer sp. SSB1]MBK5570762.1 VOC family protein [Ensifer sp. SSB1]